MSSSRSRERATQSSASSASQPSARSAAMSRSSSPTLSSIWSTWRAAARSLSGGNTTRLTRMPTAMPMLVSTSRSASVPDAGAVAGREHDQCRGRDGHALGAEQRQRPDHEAQHQGGREGGHVDAEDAADREGEQHPDHRGTHGLQAAGERAVDGGVHREKCRPRRQERLVVPGHLHRHHPGDDGRDHGLRDLQRVGLVHRVGDVRLQPAAQAGAPLHDPDATRSGV